MDPSYVTPFCHARESGHPGILYLDSCFRWNDRQIRIKAKVDLKSTYFGNPPPSRRGRVDFGLVEVKTLTSLPQIPIDDGVIERASQWGFLLDKKGKSVSTTDLLIAAASYKKACLLHADNDFEVISSTVDLDEERIELS